jgi:uncharacterized protein DUF4932
LWVFYTRTVKFLQLYFLMKKALITAFISCISLISLGQTGNSDDQVHAPAVDKRVELLSIAARLAGYPEYNKDNNRAYVADIHQYFDKYKEHPFITFLHEARVTHSTGYDAVMSMAVHLQQPPDLTRIATHDEANDKRILDTSATFIALLQQFYTDTDFETFYKKHAAYYKTTESQFDIIFKQFDVAWYHKYYGVAPKEKFVILIGIGNGGGNYGPKVIWPDGREIAYAVLGEWRFDSLGTPLFDDQSLYLPTLVHEFNHSFVNYINDAHQKDLEKAGNTIFQAVADKMRKQAYEHWQSMMNEALVRASVIRYLQTHNTDTTVAYKELQEQLSMGYVWMDKLVDLLGTYESDRKTYPTLESFMPRIIAFYNDVAINIDRLKSDYDKTIAHVTSITPFANGDTSVSATIKEIRINFDRPLAGGGASIRYTKMGKDHYPITKFIGYTDNNKAILLQVDLKPDFEYQFFLSGASFRTPDGRPMDDYKVSFKTSK